MAFDFQELQNLLQQAENTAAAEASIRKALVRVENYQDAINKEIHAIYALLDGNLPAAPTSTRGGARGKVERDADAPYGRKKDGTPMKPRGRGAASKADGSGTGDLGLDATSTADGADDTGAAANDDTENKQESAADISPRIEAGVKPAAKAARAVKAK